MVVWEKGGICGIISWDESQGYEKVCTLTLLHNNDEINCCIPVRITTELFNLDTCTGLGVWCIRMQIHPKIFPCGSVFLEKLF